MVITPTYSQPTFSSWARLSNRLYPPQVGRNVLLAARAVKKIRFLNQRRKGGPTATQWPPLLLKMSRLLNRTKFRQLTTGSPVHTGKDSSTGAAHNTNASHSQTPRRSAVSLPPAFTGVLSYRKCPDRTTKKGTPSGGRDRGNGSPPARPVGGGTSAPDGGGPASDFVKANPTLAGIAPKPGRPTGGWKRSGERKRYPPEPPGRRAAQAEGFSRIDRATLYSTVTTKKPMP